MMQNIKLITLQLIFLFAPIAGIKAQKMVGEELPGFQNSEFYDMNASISPDGKRLIFIRIIMEKKKEKKYFYESIREGDNWSEPKPLHLINLAKG